MADTTILASTAVGGEQNAIQVWSKNTMREAKEHSCFYYITGNDAGSVVFEQNELTKEQGDAIYVSLTENIQLNTGVTGHGIGGEGTLTGSEYGLVDRSDRVQIDQLRQAMRTKGKLTEKRSSYDVREEMKDKLMHWAPRVNDKIIFHKLSGATFLDSSSSTTFGVAGANTNVFWPGTVTQLSELAATDIFDLNLVQDAAVCAKMGEIGSTSIYKMRPTMVDGEPHYICLLSPYQANAVRHSQLWRDAISNARERAMTNPFWTGVTSVWQNVVFKEHDLVYAGTNAGPGEDVAYAVALLLGGQAFVKAPCQDGYDWIEEKFDYGQKWGIATGFVAGYEKIQFNSVDFSCIAIITAAQNPRL